MIIIKKINYKHEYYNRYGHHFNEKLCLYAIDNLYLKDTNGNKTRIVPITLGLLMLMSNSNNVDLSKYNIYDCLYVANMCKADFFGSSIIDNMHLLLYIKNTLDDPDGYDGLVFNRWKADQKGLHIKIEWKDFL